MDQDPHAALRRFVGSADEDAFRELIARFWPMVLGVCRRVTGPGGDAEDAAHETFVRLARHAHEIRGGLGSWLYTCALNVARDLRSASAARRAREHAYAHATPPPEVPAFDAEDVALLDTCLQRLRDQDRDVIAQYYFLGLSQERIAARYGITQAAVNRRLDRAVRALRFAMVRAGCDLSTATTSRAGAVGPDGELDLLSFGGVLIDLLIGGHGLAAGAAAAARGRDGMGAGSLLGRGMAAVARGLLLDDSDLGRRRRPRFDLPGTPLHVAVLREATEALGGAWRWCRRIRAA